MTMHRVLAALGCALAAVLTTAWSPAPPAPPAPDAATVVRTHHGLVRGVHRDGYRTFAGIPYAAPPVGILRWAPPAPAAAWAGTRDAPRAPAPKRPARCPPAAPTRTAST